MLISSTRRTAPRKRQHRWIAALVALGLTATGVVAYTAAANAAVANVTYVSDASGGTSTVNATVLTSASGSLTDTWNVCNSTLTINAQMYAMAAATNLILADNCNLTVNSPTNVNIPNPGIGTMQGYTFTIYGGVNNTGRATFNSSNGPGIGNAFGGVAGNITINGGHIRAIAGTSAANYSFPGIGTSYTNSTGVGAILIRWNASVYAMGSNGTNTNSPSAPGIGSGVWNSTTSTTTGAISINTTGIVQAQAGSASTQLPLVSPNIGRGASTSSTYSPTINTYNISRGEVGPGTTRMFDQSGVISASTTLNNVAAGSSVTYIATPNTGAKTRTVDTNLVLVSGDGIGTSTYRLPVASNTGNVTKYAYFWYSTTPTATTTPASSQTFPGNVTINGSITQNSTSTLIGSNGQAQLWINGVLAQTQDVTAGKVTFTHTSPLPGTYSYQIKYLGVTTSPFLATSESVPLTGFEVLGTPQNLLSFTGLDSTKYTYGDAPIPVTVTGGSGTGEYNLTSSDPAVASFGTITAGTSPLTINQAGTFTVTGTRAGDTDYAEATLTSPPTTVTAATPVATLTRTGGNTQTTPVDVTMTVEARGTGTTPQGYVQFSLNNQALGDPLPLVDNGDGTASVSLTGIPLTNAQSSHSIEANYLGQTGKYTTVAKTDSCTTGACLAPSL